MQKSHAARRAKVGALAIFLSGTACFNTSPGATPDAGSFDAGIHEAGTGSDSGSDPATMDAAADAATLDASTAECTVASDCDDVHAAEWRHAYPGHLLHRNVRRQHQGLDARHDVGNRSGDCEPDRSASGPAVASRSHVGP